MWRALVISVTVLMVASVARAETIATLFDYDNQVGNGGVMFFDVEVTNPGGITITGFDSNVLADPGFNLFLSVLTTTGTYVGNTQNPGVWTPRGIGEGMTAGPNNPSFADTPDFDLAPGSYGFMMILSHDDPNSSFGHAFTDGPLGPYSNSDLTLTLGASANFPFGPSTADSIWNGTIHYIPAPASVVLLLGLGALGRNRRR